MSSQSYPVFSVVPIIVLILDLSSLRTTRSGFIGGSSREVRISFQDLSSSMRQTLQVRLGRPFVMVPQRPLMFGPTEQVGTCAENLSITCQPMLVRRFQQCHIKQMKPGQLTDTSHVSFTYCSPLIQTEKNCQKAKQH